MNRVLNIDSQTSEFAAPTNYTGVDLNEAKGYGISQQVTVTTPAAKTFTAVAATDLCTAASHGFKTGLKVRGTTTTTLPAGLALSTDYFVIVVSANTFKLASSLANAQAGTAIDITDAGTGTHTLTPTAIAGGSVKLQASFDDITYFDLGVSNNITATADFFYEKIDPMFRYVRAAYTLTAGQISVVQKTCVKG